MNLITRGDLDGLTSSVLVTEKEEIDEVRFTHPKDMQDGKVEVFTDDIIVNLPYHENCAMWFDHHDSEVDAPKTPPDVKGKQGIAPSAARLVYEYYDDPALARFGELLAETDRVDSARLGMEDVLNPNRFVLLSYTLDPRSGLGAFKRYFLNLIDWLKTKKIEEIMEIPEVEGRVRMILSEQERYRQALLETSYLDDNVVVTDFRRFDTTPAGNRFLIYTLFPQSNISARMFHGKDQGFVVVAVGHSIFNRTSKTHVGNLLAEYGGGGLRGAGTAQLPTDTADETISKIIERMKQDG
jgi:hypothetical protein|tara:strand:+ start:444 stop:1334 length:891 start_codon:yes stop_codon:yes gene_type:complete